MRSESIWSSPSFIISKKSVAGEKPTYGLVIDYRQLNSLCEDARQLNPGIEDIVDTTAINNPRYLTNLDLSNAYYPVPIRPTDVELTSFTTSRGQFAFKKLPFDLKTAPSTFNLLINILMGNSQYQNMMAYLDDLIIFSRTFEDHLQDLQNIFNRLRGGGLKLKASKCNFAKNEIEYLGYIIGAEGLKCNPKKLDILRDFPRPKNLKEVRAFLGFTGFYRRFMRSYAKLTSNLTRLLRKGTKFEWDKDCEESFQQLKLALLQSPPLAYPDLNKQFYVTCDACKSSIGYVLEQTDSDGNFVLIQANGRQMNEAEKNFSTLEQEALSIVEAVKLWRPFLAGNKFSIRTDHRGLETMFDTKLARMKNARVMRWAIFLSEFSYEIQYIRGKENKADYISRLPFDEQKTDPDDYSDDLLNPNVTIAATYTKIDKTEKYAAASGAQYVPENGGEHEFNSLPFWPDENQNEEISVATIFYDNNENVPDFDVNL